MSRSGSTTVRVRYAETDEMGVAWHGEYLAWFEVGRTDLLRGCGCSYRELEAQGLRHEVRRQGTDGPLAVGSTAHGAIDLKGRPRPIPEDLLRKLA